MISISIPLSHARSGSLKRVKPKSVALWVLGASALCSAPGFAISGAMHRDPHDGLSRVSHAMNLPDEIYGRWEGQVKSYPLNTKIKIDYIVEPGLVTIQVLAQSNSRLAPNRVSRTDIVFDLQARPSPVVAGAHEIDLTYARMLETPLSLEDVNSKNENAECGITDWEIGVARDVTLVDCHESELKVGETMHTLLKIEDGSMYFGDSEASPALDGSTPEKRPVAFKMDEPYRRRSGEED